MRGTLRIRSGIVGRFGSCDNNGDTGGVPGFVALAGALAGAVLVAPAAIAAIAAFGVAGAFGAVGVVGVAAAGASDADPDLLNELADNAIDDAGKICVGGESFTGSAKVLLASGAAIPISQLKPGDKVLATSTRTGKTQAEPVTAVLLHHDSNLYDLTVSTGHRTAVIHTTRNHLFWDPADHRWVKAAALRHGTHLRTANGSLATAIGGHDPKAATGWMWDLTVPGNNDHDFYIQTATAAILVHNEDGPCPDESNLVNLASDARTNHILNGDETGGGHLWPGLSSKTPFPEGWSAARVMNAISDIVTDQAAWDNAVQQGSKTVLVGTSDGVEIRVIVNTNTGDIISGYPINLPRNP